MAEDIAPDGESQVPTRAEATAALTGPGGPFEMEEVVVRGVPLRAWKSAPANLRTVFELSAGHGDKTFLVYEDERVTFEEHYVTVAALGRQLVERFGIRPGDRVAIAMRNLPEWVTAFWATITVGAVAVPLNAWWTGEELAYGLADSGTRVAFVDEERQGRITHHLAEVPGLEAMIVTCEEHDPDSGGRRPAVGCTLDRGAAGSLPVVPFADVVGDPADGTALVEVDIDPDDDATIFYTSGTTGRPKGAVGTHRNSVSNLMNLFFVSTVGGMRRTKAQIAASPGVQNANLLSVPLFHATGCHALLVTNTAAGGKLVMMHHFDPERALELIERERITVFGGVPAMVMQVIDSPDFAKRDTSSVQSISYGGAPCPPDLVRRIKEHFPTGAPGNGYGLTETSAMTTMNTGDDYVRKPDSVGPPAPVCDVAVVPEDWEGAEPPDLPADPDRTGELWIRGPNVVRGYWGKPEATAASFTRGWLHTGDVARIDDEGFVHIVDRAKDMIIRGGENVYCVEIEGALHEHPAVADCAVIGVPHPVLGEEVGAVVVLRPGMEVAADELSRHVRERLAAFNVPSRYWFRGEELPRNPAGKILKRELRTELLGDAPVF
jgi:long-chain acyl-CoA synthetase